MKIESKEIKLVPLSEIKLNPKNRNKHPTDQIDRLIDIIKYQGFRRPVTISNLSGFLSCGEGRYLAAKKLKINAIPAMYQDYDSPEQEYADGIADNAIDKWAELDLTSIQNDLADLGKDFNIDVLGIKNFELDSIAEGLCDEDEVPEVVEPKSKLGDIYQLGEHRLMCGDSTSITAVELLMDGEKADMVFTDPPYNIDYSPEDRAIGGRARSKNKLGKIDNDNMSDDSFYDFLSGVNAAIITATKPGAAIYQCAPIGLNNLQYLMAWRDIGFHYSDGLIWLKNNHSISRKDYHPKHEVIHYGWMNGSHKWFGERNKFSVFECAREKVQDYKHPTQKPVELSTHFIENSSQQNDCVIDLFGGSGSTLIACEKTNRKCFMMELDPHYCDVIVARWEKFTGKKAELING